MLSWRSCLRRWWDWRERFQILIRVLRGGVSMTGPHADFRKRPHSRRKSLQGWASAALRCVMEPLWRRALQHPARSSRYHLDVFHLRCLVVHHRPLACEQPGVRLQSGVAQPRDHHLRPQCSFRLGRWKYTTIEGGKAHWNTSNPTCSRFEWTANSWHHLVIQFHRDATGVVTYDSVSFDGNVQAFNDASGPSNFPLRWYPPGLQVVNFQIGGDNSSHGTTAYLDSFSVTGSAEPVSSRLAVPAR